MKLADLRAGLKANLEASIDKVAVSGYMQSSPAIPGFEIDIDSDGIEFDRSMGRGLDEIFLVVRGFVGTASDIASQKKMDEWIDGAVVKKAIESDRTLGGACADLQVTRMGNYRVFASVSTPNAFYLGCEWYVRILGAGEN